MYIILIVLLFFITTVAYVKSKVKPSLQKNVKFIVFSIALSFFIGWLNGPIEMRHSDFPWWAISVLIAPLLYSFLLLGYFAYWSKRNKFEPESNST